MYLQTLLFFLATLLAAGVTLAFPTFSTKYLDLILAFGGSYLFGLTLLHILPEVFEHAGSNLRVGYYLLLGFFLQLVLDAFGGSVTHGHSYTHNGHRPFQASTATLLVALFLHASLDGVLLHEENFSVWFSIWFHKLPVLFTLGSILQHRQNSRRAIGIIFFLFALTTPLSFLVHQNLQLHYFVNNKAFRALNAVAAGGLFHIASMILFESNPHHDFDRKRWYTIIGGIGMSILNNYFISHE